MQKPGFRPRTGKRLYSVETRPSASQMLTGESQAVLTCVLTTLPVSSANVKAA